MDRPASRLGTESDPAANEEGVSQKSLVSLRTLRVLPNAPLDRSNCTQVAEYLVVCQEYYYPITSSGHCRPLPTDMLHSRALDLTQYNTLYIIFNIYSLISYICRLYFFYIFFIIFLIYFLEYLVFIVSFIINIQSEYSDKEIQRKDRCKKM